MTVVAAQTLYNWLLFLHVFAAMIWVGGGVILAVIAGRVLRDPERNAVARFTGRLDMVGPLVLDSDAWDFGPLWVQLGLGLFASAFLIGAQARRQLERWSCGYRLIVLSLIVAA